MADDRFLITGGTGCIGSWVVRGLLREGAPVTVVSTGRRRDRLSLILTAAELAAVDVVEADVARPRGDRGGRPAFGCDGNRPPRRPPAPAVRRGPGGGCARERPGDGHGLRARAPPRDRARRLREQRGRLRPDGQLLRSRSWARTRTLPRPRTTACSRSPTSRPRASTGRRAGSRASGCGRTPSYGPGRDQGVTSKPTLAMIAAAGGRAYHVDFGGSYQFQFVEDVAAAFIAAARADRPERTCSASAGRRIGRG